MTDDEWWVVGLTSDTIQSEWLVKSTNGDLWDLMLEECARLGPNDLML